MHAVRGSNPIPIIMETTALRSHTASRGTVRASVIDDSGKSHSINSPKMNIARFALVVAVWAIATNALAQTVWTDATGDWFNAGNWSAGVPNSTTSAQINNGGTAQITSSGAAAGDVTLGLASSD